MTLLQRRRQGTVTRHPTNLLGKAKTRLDHCRIKGAESMVGLVIRAEMARVGAGANAHPNV